MSGALLKAARLHRGLTQAALANRLQLARSVTISERESSGDPATAKDEEEFRKLGVSWEVWLAYCQVLDLDPSWTPEPAPPPKKKR